MVYAVCGKTLIARILGIYPLCNPVSDTSPPGFWRYEGRFPGFEHEIGGSRGSEPDLPAKTVSVPTYLDK